MARLALVFWKGFCDASFDVASALNDVFWNTAPVFRASLAAAWGALHFAVFLLAHWSVPFILFAGHATLAGRDVVTSKSSSRR